MALNFLVATPLAGVLCVVMSPTPGDWYQVSWFGLGCAAYIGTIEMGLAFLCWSRALALAENAARVSILIFISPFLSLILISQVLGETIAYTTILGLIGIVGGLLVQQVCRSRLTNNQLIDNGSV